MDLKEDILRNIDIVDYISKFVSLRKSGANWVGNCPFHKEKTPSFMVSDSKGIYKCFWCGKGGDVITFAMEYERLDFVDALKYLWEYAHIDTTKYAKFTPDPAIKESKEQTKNLNQVISNHFQALLKDDKVALGYLHNRHIDDAIIEQFQIGYAPDGYHDAINYLKKYGFSEEQIIESWLCKVGTSGDIYDFFRKRIIFPIQDIVGNIVGFGGRVIDPQDNPKYLNLSDTPLYDKSKILYGINFAKKNVVEHGKIIVVEWYMDVIGLHRLGLPIGVATCGTALTADHIKILKRTTDHVYFLFDNDDAGFSATVRGLKIAYSQDLYPQVLQFTKISTPEKPIKDVDDFANIGGTTDQLMETSTDGLLYVMQHLKTQYNISNPVDKKKVTNSVFEIIAAIADMSIMQHYLKEISLGLDISEQILLSQYKIRYKQNKVGIRQEKQEQKSSDSTGMDSKALIHALIASENLSDYTQDESGKNALDFYQELLKVHYQKDLNIETWVTDQQSALLWRDHEVLPFDEVKKAQFIKQLVGKLIDEELRDIIKTSVLSPEQKTEILEKRKKLR